MAFLQQPHQRGEPIIVLRARSQVRGHPGPHTGLGSGSLVLMVRILASPLILTHSRLPKGVRARSFHLKDAWMHSLRRPATSLLQREKSFFVVTSSRCVARRSS